MAANRKTRTDGTRPDTQVSDEMVAKVGAAVGHVAMIRQEYTERVQSLETDDERENLAARAQQAAVKAIDEQGISIAEYNEVVTAAEQDPELENRLLVAAREAS